MDRAGAVLVSGGWRSYLLWALAAAVLGVSLALQWRYFGETAWRILTPDVNVHGDFEAFYGSARAWLSGGDVYETGTRLTNLNPPIWVPLFAPFALLEPLPAYRAYTVFSAAVALSALLWVSFEARLARGAGAIGGALAVGVLLFSAPMLATLALGQVYPVLALLLVAAWWAERRGKEALSGCALGLVVALKPTLAPVLLWPAVRRRWRGFFAAMLAGGGATLAALAILGPAATLGWLREMRGVRLTAFWDNASIPAAAARLFTEHEFGAPLAVFPPAVPLSFALGAVLLALTAYRARLGGEGAVWALAAASLLVSPIAWHTYLVVLAPGVLLLLARGRLAAGVLLLTLATVPAQWPGLWTLGAENGAVHPSAAALASSLYLPVLLAHWAAFYSLPAPEPAGDDDRRQGLKGRTTALETASGR